MNTRAQTGDVRVSQGAVVYPQNRRPQMLAPFPAKVIYVHSLRMTCDVKAFDGTLIENVPMLVPEAGLVDGKVYGVFSLPNVDDYVIVGHVGETERQRAIIGTFIPYLEKAHAGAAVNSSNKQFTKKLLEDGKAEESGRDKNYRRIFKSGTTVEILEDGSLVVETPTGSYIQIDEENNQIIIQQKNGSDITKVTIDPDGIIVEDLNGNKITMSSSGMVLEDKNGNDITMASGKVTINGNLEVAQ